MRELRETIDEASARRGSLRRRASVSALAALAVLTLIVPGTPAAAQESDRPPAPQGLSVSATTHSSVTLSWTASDDGSVTGYQVLRRDHGDGAASTYAVVADLLGSSIRSFVDYGVSPSSTYFYRIKARNSAGLSGWSAYVRADTPAAPAGSLNWDKQTLPVSDDKESDDGSVGQRSSHDETPPASTPPSQPTASASGPSNEPPDDSDESDGEQETQPPPTEEQRKDRLVVRVAPSQ